MELAITSIHMVERAPRNDCHQCRVPRVSSSCLLPLREALQDQQVGLIQAPFKLLLLPWALDPVRFLWAPFNSGVSISHSPLALPKVSLAGLQSQTFWGFIFLVWNLKKQNTWTNITKQKQSYRYREQTGGCQRGEVCGEERNRWVGEIKRYKLPVAK